jgi:protocatechuate 3,4-dioxygenase, beta subunit
MSKKNISSTYYTIVKCYIPIKITAFVFALFIFAISHFSHSTNAFGKTPKNSNIHHLQKSQITKINNNTNADPILITDCVFTPIIWDPIPQPNIYMGNNLWRYVGSSKFAKGKYIKLTGRVLDKKCVPVDNATVEIWQLDSNGLDANYYEHGTEPDLKIAPERAISGREDRNFVGSGSTTTDNLGYYTFYTIIPGSLEKDRKPHINFQVYHQNMGLLRTQMYFPNAEISSSQDKVLDKKIKDKNKQKLLISKKQGTQKGLLKNIDVTIYNFDIVFDKKNKYKEY